MFGSDESGSLIEPAAGLGVQELLLLMPVSMRTLAATPGFLAQVQEIAATWANVAADQPEQTPDAIKQIIHRVRTAAHAMRNELGVLAGGSEAFRDLQTGSMYLFLRNNEVDAPAPGRPVVPALPTDARSLDQLLQRVHGDLEALRVCTEHTAQNIKPAKSRAKWIEREVVKLVAMAHQAAFGKPPPKRSWFGNDFMPFVGECMNLEIGHRVVGEEVSGTH
jgi:hypothetical protein